MRFALLLLVLLSGIALAQDYDPNPAYDLGLPGTQGPVDPHLFYLETGMTPGDWNKLTNAQKEQFAAKLQCKEARDQIDEQLAFEHAGHVGIYDWRSLREVEKARCGSMAYRLGESPNDTYPAAYAKHQADMMKADHGMPMPAYPVAALRQGHQGTVGIQVDVAKDGSVTNATVTQSSGYPELDRAAQQNAYRWKLDPSKGATQTYPVDFHLNVSH